MNNIVIEDYFGVVHNIIKTRFSKVLIMYDYNDLFQVGCIGLLTAKKDFDESKGVKFLTFAYNMVKWEINKFLRSDTWKLGSTTDRLTGKAQIPLSMNFKVNEEEDEIKGNWCIEESFEERTIEKIFIDDLLIRLTERERYIVTQYVFEVKTFREISEGMNIKHERVRQIYKEAIKKLEYAINPVGYSKDKFACKIRNARTGEEIHFKSFSKCNKFLGKYLTYVNEHFKRNNNKDIIVGEWRVIKL